MKRFLVISVLLFFYIAGYGQVTLEKTYGYSTSVVKLETLGYKYFLMDVPNAQCRIYNMDHSLFKTINCPVPNGNFLYDIKFVSEKLFNSDDRIELMYSYYKYVSNTYYVYGSKLVNEDGTNLLTIDGAQYIFINKTGDSEYKLFAYVFDYSVSPEKVSTNVYKLPGTVVSAVALSESQPDVLLKAYPNPASDFVHVGYELPANVKSASLTILNSGGQVVKTYQIDNHSDHIVMNVKDVSSGIYHYFIEYNQQRSPARQIVVQ